LVSLNLIGDVFNSKSNSPNHFSYEKLESGHEDFTLHAGEADVHATAEAKMLWAKAKG
jgi:hypothetical protein